MAVKILTVSGNLSTSGGNWLNCDQYNLDYNANAQATSNQDDISTARYLALTFSGTLNIKGFFLALSYNAAISTNLETELVLQKNISGTWTDVARGSRITTGYVRPDYVARNIKNRASYIVFDEVWDGASWVAGTSYTVDNSASTWRIKVYTTTLATRIYWLKSATGAYIFASVDDSSTTKPSSGDTIITAHDVDLTIDESLTLGAVNTYTSMVLGDSSNLTWETSPTVSHTLDLGTGFIYCYGEHNITIGTVANPIPITSQAIIRTNTNVVGALYQGFFVGRYSQDASETELVINGEVQTHVQDALAGTVSSGQKDVNTQTDLSGIWAPGDEVFFIGSLTASGNDSTNNTIASISGTTITLTNNITYNVHANGVIVNRTRALQHGVMFDNIGATAQTQTILNIIAPGGYNILSWQMQGVALKYVGAFFTPNYYYLKQNTADFQDIYQISVCYQGNGLGTYNSGTGTVGGVYKNIIIDFNSSIANYALGRVGGVNCVVENIYLRNHSYYSPSYGGLFGVNSTYKNILVQLYRSTFSASGVFLMDNVIGGTVDDVYIFNGKAEVGGINQEYSNINSYNSATYALSANQCIGTIVRNSDLGDTSACAYEVIAPYLTNLLIQAKFVDCGLAGTGIGDMQYSLAGSYLAFQNFDNIAEDHRLYMVDGVVSRSGPSLSDTFSFTSGEYAIKMTPKATSSGNFFTSMKKPVNADSQVVFYGKYRKTAAYGSSNLPRIRLYSDDGEVDVSETITDVDDTTISFCVSGQVGSIATNVYCELYAEGTSGVAYFGDMFLVVGNITTGSAIAYSVGTLWSNGLPTADKTLGASVDKTFLENSVWDAVQANHLIAGSTGQNLASMGQSISSIESDLSDTQDLIAGVQSSVDNIQNSIDVLSPIIENIASDVWEEILSEHITSGSFGKAVKDISIKVDDAGILKGFT